MYFIIASLVSLASLAAVAAASPVKDSQPIVKRETSYGNPDLVVDQGDRWKLNFGSTGGHPNACPGSYICCKLPFYERYADAASLTEVTRPQTSPRTVRATTMSRSVTLIILSTRATAGASTTQPAAARTLAMVTTCELHSYID